MANSITNASIKNSLEEIAQNFKNGIDKSKVDRKENASNENSFIDHLQDSLKEVNNKQNKSEKMAAAIASGKTENIHETMLALTQAELSFNLMVQVRNKALEAYQEVMRMPV